MVDEEVSKYDTWDAKVISYTHEMYFDCPKGWKVHNDLICGEPVSMHLYIHRIRKNALPP